MISIGIFLLYYYGMFAKINRGDLTKISFGIMALFIIFSVQIGVLTYKIKSLAKDNLQAIVEESQRYIGSKLSTARWFADKFITLGMIGTVIGFLFTLDTVFCGIDASNIGSMQAALTNMAKGMGTALYTTASGLICSFLLKLQIYNLEIGLSCEIQDF